MDYDAMRPPAWGAASHHRQLQSGGGRGRAVHLPELGLPGRHLCNNNPEVVTAIVSYHSQCLQCGVNYDVLG